MFNGPIVWRGLIYSTLMLIGKLLCGAWLIRFSMSLPRQVKLQRAITAIQSMYNSRLRSRQKSRAPAEPRVNRQGNDQDLPTPLGSPNNAENSQTTMPAESDDIASAPRTQASPQHDCHNKAVGTVSHDILPATKPFSLYPCAILGLAMVARGEISFLISSLAESNSVFSVRGNDQIFLIVTWAIVVCTVIGPLGVGLLVRRVKRLEKVK